MMYEWISTERCRRNGDLHIDFPSHHWIEIFDPLSSNIAKRNAGNGTDRTDITSAYITTCGGAPPPRPPRPVSTVNIRYIIRNFVVTSDVFLPIGTRSRSLFLVRFRGSRYGALAPRE